MTILDRFSGPILVERAAYLLENKYGIPNEREQIAARAINYLYDIGYTNSPHWIKLSSAITPNSRGNNLFQASSMGTARNATVLEKIISHDYNDALYILESSKTVANVGYYRHVEQVAQVLMLQKNFKALEQLEYRIHNSVNDVQNPDEINSYRKIILLICMAYYLQRKYFDCCYKFFRYLNLDNDLIASFQTVGAKYDFISTDEILLAVTISIIISIPFSSYKDFIHIKSNEIFFKVYPLSLKLMKLIIHINFQKFFGIWHVEIDQLCQRSIFLGKHWSFAQTLMRTKIYIFYFKISQKLKISYLANILKIDNSLIKKEVELLISSAHINVEFEDKDTLVFNQTHVYNHPLKSLQRNERDIETVIQDKRKRLQQLRDFIQEASTQGLNSTNSEEGKMDITDLNNDSDMSDI
ncbi:hypothetical protein KAFR_0B01310 [Kazachstania africana CBS 2517]|uniref:PCI domain-containing protein n=1 Tax=Kazachstania africana (strain ATCC 22294 / BCRC 22015 / CBS 2517 / CECT 1963 / NBRC 1671 / NRRL Y-8276) TaxID=1071382 RepID=H2APY0_KAZAF|nr:hypothetical protein KAFR_0B01310 [Kazachstania africana CBS 2517]CCF56430.1 hypothetical protein KAFR_0B01310 [Kazachstania africana CBS 2517]